MNLNPDWGQCDESIWKGFDYLSSSTDNLFNVPKMGLVKIFKNAKKIMFVTSNEKSVYVVSFYWLLHFMKNAKNIETVTLKSDEIHPKKSQTWLQFAWNKFDQRLVRLYASNNYEISFKRDDVDRVPLEIGHAYDWITITKLN